MVINWKKAHVFLPWIFFLSLFLALSSAFSCEKRAFVPEDFLSIKRLSDPQISPSGEWVAFVVSQFEKDRTMNSEIWLVSSDGLTLKQLTKDPGPDLAPRWSPDGKTVAFLSRNGKEKHSQIYFYSLKEKKAKKITNEESSIRDLKWSPDSRKIAFLMSDPLTPEEQERIANGDDAFVVDHDYRHRRLWILDVETRKTSLLSHQKMTVWNFNWSPDCKKIALLASPIPTAEGNEYQSHLSLIDVLSGEESVLSKKTNAQAAPSFSPDGKWIAYMGPVGNFKERGIIKVISAEGGEPLELLREYEGNAWDIAWHPRKNEILAGVARGISHWLSVVNFKGEVRDLFEIQHSIIPYWGNFWSVSADGKLVAFLSETTKGPKEIWLSDLNSSNKKQLTNFNDYLQEVELGRVEAVTWINPKDESRVDGILVKPPNFELQRRFPLIVWFHGGPAYNWSLGAQIANWAQLFAGRGYLVFLPNFRGSSGHGMNWMMANVEDWGEGPMSDVMSGVDFLIEEGMADEGRLYVGGRSYGGYLTSWAITHTDRFKAAFISAGVTDLITEYALTDEPSFLIGYFNSTPYENPEIYQRNSSITYASRAKTPVLIVHGERDLRVPVSQAFQFYSALKHHGAKTTLVIYPREYHGIREYTHQIELINRVLGWFDKFGVNP